MGSPSANHKASGVTGTGASLDVHSFGHTPKKISLSNAITGVTMWWAENMVNGTAFKLKAGVQTQVQTNGITPYHDGFNIGTDPDINVNGQTIYWECSE